MEAPHREVNLANSKETESFGENGCRQKCLDKTLLKGLWSHYSPDACVYLLGIMFINYLMKPLIFVTYSCFS